MYDMFETIIRSQKVEQGSDVIVRHLHMSYGLVVISPRVRRLLSHIQAVNISTGFGIGQYRQGGIFKERSANLRTDILHAWWLILIEFVLLGE
jgi:hypothetical protein